MAHIVEKNCVAEKALDLRYDLGRGWVGGRGGGLEGGGEEARCAAVRRGHGG